VTVGHDVPASAPPTEGRNPRTRDIDRLSTVDVLNRIHAEDALVPAAVATALPALADVVDAAVLRFRTGGTIHYFGAGTSGRLAALDAAELPPTYSVNPLRFVAHQAGGTAAGQHAIEDAEDDRESGAAIAESLGRHDLAIGIAASGRTPFVEAALRAAHERGAYTALFSSNPDAPLAALVDRHVCAPTGPEAIAGSTRMKAGTAAKLLLNSFSTAMMVRLGKTYSNLMIDVAASNTKLRTRMVTILAEATGADLDSCAATLAASGNELRTALVSIIAGTPPEVSRATLAATNGDVAAAISRCDRRPNGNHSTTPDMS
jgi:N-acetylmuramic acid 6-phosphate etherase